MAVLPKAAPSFIPADNLEALLEAKLESSGLSTQDGLDLGYEALSAAEVKALDRSFWGVPALRLPYYDIKGKPMLEGGKPFYRLRWLRPPPSPVGETREPARYLQPARTNPHAYFPQLGVNWQAMASDPNEDLMITEGELKAAAATSKGFPCVGMGGVDSFRSLKRGVLLLPELEEFEWVHRRVHICYDSDVVEKPAVCRALMALAEELMHRGALPEVVFLPNVTKDPEAKTGLDDFLLARGPIALRDLIEHESSPLTLAISLWRLNAEYVWVRKLARVLTTDTGVIIDKGDLPLYDTARHPQRTVTPGGRGSYALVPALPVWVTWPLRREVDVLCYEPALRPLSDVELPVGPDRRQAIRGFNVWPGWGCQPADKVDDKTLAPFLRVLRHLFTDAAPGLQDYLLDWLACPLQQPGVKLKTSCMIYGAGQGTGKSLIGYTMQRIYGLDNFSEINERDFHGDFNEWCAHKQFVLGDDVSGSDKKSDRETLKKMITQHSISINIKHKPLYRLRDCVNYLWTSNQPDAFMLEDNDRRFFVHEVIVDPLSDEFFTNYFEWLDGPGAGLVFRYLLDRDLSRFNPHAKAPRSAAKNAMTAIGQSDIAAWVRVLRAQPDSLLRSGAVVSDCALWTPAQLLSLYDPEGKTRITPQVMLRELTRARIPLAAGGTPLVPKGGGPAAVHFALRDPEHWRSATAAEAAKHLTPGGKSTSKKRKM